MLDDHSVTDAGEETTIARRGAIDALQAIDDLARRAQFVAWRSKAVPGKAKPTKIPINPRSGGMASVSDARTWGSRENAEARARADSLAGIGYVLTDDDDLTGIDLDGCVDAEGRPEGWAAEIIGLAETYAETSPSGRGLRLFARGKIDRAIKSDAAGVEVYDRGRYLTITGQHVAGTPKDIRPAPATLEALRARVAAVSARPMHASRNGPQAPPRSARPPAAAMAGAMGSFGL